MKLRVLDLFSGIGGFSLGLERATHNGEIDGFETVAFCEIEAFPRKVLAKHWPEVPCYDDVRTLTAERLAADGIAVDVICGGFPCQDLSATGAQAGIGEGTRSGLFRHMVRLVAETRAEFAIFENVARLLSGPKEAPSEWFGEFLWALAEIGYNAEWFSITAASIGAPHERDRVWIVAYPDKAQLERGRISRRVYAQHADFSDTRWGQDKPGVERASNGLPQQMDRVGALGNAVVPQIPELIGRAILDAINADTQTAEKA
jgi:DNA (cytosine-5)-methyltransferase 1